MYSMAEADPVVLKGGTVRVECLGQEYNTVTPAST